MKSLRRDIWELAAAKMAHPGRVAVCITTNGALRNDGRAIMGRGVALEAKNRFPGIDIVVGENIRDDGNHVAMLGRNIRFELVMFPVKHHWREMADEAFGRMIGLMETVGIVVP